MEEEIYQSSTFMSLRRFSDIQLSVQSEVPRKRVQIVETRLVRKTSTLYERRNIDTPSAAADLGRKLFEHYDKEYFYAVYLTARCEPIAIELVSIGTLDGALVSPRDLMKTAMLCSAYGFIAYHNHPSGGDITPSKEDISITERIRDAGKLMGIRILDHLILSDIGYVSLKERGIL